MTEEIPMSKLTKEYNQSVLALMNGLEERSDLSYEERWKRLKSKIEESLATIEIQENMDYKAVYGDNSTVSTEGDSGGE